jgi:hypothetical protein
VRGGAAGPTRGGAGAGTHRDLPISTRTSALERNYVHGVERAHGLPTARRQAKRRLGSGTRYLDNLYEDGVCVELDGLAAHPEEGRWRDTHRDNANQVLGTRTLRYGWPDATERRCATAAEIAAVLRRHGWQGTPRRCGPGCAIASGKAVAGADRGAGGEPGTSGESGTSRRSPSRTAGQELAAS